jgi:hypothetical protein
MDPENELGLRFHSHMEYSLYPCRLEVSEWLCCVVVSVHAYLVGRFERESSVCIRFRSCLLTYLLTHLLTTTDS